MSATLLQICAVLCDKAVAQETCADSAHNRYASYFDVTAVTGVLNERHNSKADKILLLQLAQTAAML